ncbi:hypothetical protein F5148DRAFT_990675, partial [Russula earlei]
MRDYVKGKGKYEWCLGQPNIDPYVHYQLVLETLGQPLSTFKLTWQLCQVIWDAIMAHVIAYERTKILHQDVSTGNILICKDGSGILINWDPSKKEDMDAQPRGPSQTGTWQFISTGLLLSPFTWLHEVPDDLESFFWVLLYVVMK